MGRGGLGRAPPVLYRWLCEPELRLVPMFGNPCDEHASVRHRPGFNVEVEMLPLVTTEALKPASPPILSCCQCTDWSRERGKVRVTFFDGCPAQTWLEIVGATEGCRFDHHEGFDLVVLRRGDWSLRAHPTRDGYEDYMMTSIFFPREELATVTRTIRRSGAPSLRAIH